MKILKRNIRLVQRAVNDLLSGTRFRFAKKSSTVVPLQKTIELVQEIKQHIAGKLHIQSILIMQHFTLEITNIFQFPIQV